MSDKIIDQKVTLTGNTPLNQHYFLLSFESEYFAKTTQPGQFLNIKIDSSDCLLRRPFSVYDIRGNEIFILYMVVGRGTKILSELQKGDSLEMLGPLGNGFSLPKSDEKVYMLAGGTGIGSIYLLFSELKKQNFENMVFATGFRKKEFCFDDLDDEKVRIFTEDGSLGTQGYVTKILDEVTADPAGKRVYACGPHGMLEAVINQLREVPCPVELSLEETMACGVGACLGCVAETLLGRETVCKHGPIFKLNEFVPTPS